VSWLVHLDQIRPSHITAGMRKESAALLQESLPLMAAGTRAEARVATKSVVRAMLTAMNWLVSHPWPVEIFATDAEAVAWLRRQEAGSG
jgi:hypothetical protein